MQGTSFNFSPNSVFVSLQHTASSKLIVTQIPQSTCTPMQIL